MAEAASAQTIASLLSELVRIRSVNPLHAGPRSGDGAEAALAQWLAARARALGADVETEDVEPGRPNVYARFAGATARTLAVDVHLDTVGVEHMAGDPFDGRIDGGRVYGRGAVDTKATLAVVLTVLGELAADGDRPTPTVELVGTVSEEAGGLAGACAYRDRLTARRERLDQLVVAEPTGCAPVHGHKGGLGLEIVIAGRAAHSSKPHLGVNAVAAAARVVVAVEAEQERLRAAHGDGDVGRVLGCGTVSTTEIAGGRARNVIPDRCELFVGRRTVDGEDPDEELRRLTGLVRDAAAPATADVRLANGLSSAAFDQPPDSELVATLAELSGRAPTVADYGSNALRYAGIAKEIVVFGPGSIDQAHGDVEWVDIDQLELAADVYRRLLRR